MPLLDLIGSIISAGDKPEVPDVTPIDIREEQKKALKANQDILPDSLDMAGKINRFSSDEIERMLKEFVGPEYDNIRGQVGKNIASELKGEVPKDVADKIAQRAAERGVGSFGGSRSPGSITRFNEAKQYGLTSLNLTNSGFDKAGRWLSMARQSEPALFNPTGAFLTPAQQYMASVGEREFQFGRDWMKNKVDAAPDPTTAAIGQWMQRTDQMVEQAAISYFSGGMGGGGMGGGKGGGGGGGGGGGTNYGQPFNYNAIGGPGYSGPSNSGPWY